MRLKEVFFLAAFTALLGGCAAQVGHAPAESRVGQAQALSPALEEKILALDPELVTTQDIRGVLAQAPAPHIISLQGGLIPVQVAMKSFAKFLIGLGYPEESVRDPRNGDYSYSSYESSDKLAGLVAWYYEHDTLRPMMLGHSLGGMQTVKTLHRLADETTTPPAVWNPLTGKPERRHEIADPLTGQLHSVIGLQVCYASALGAGGLARTIPTQWETNARLRQIPDTAEEFTGFHIDGDIVGGDNLGYGPANLFYPTGMASVRNVELPAGSSHWHLPMTDDLLKNQRVLDWIDHYVPTGESKLDARHGIDGRILWAADVWHSIKKHWVLELQRSIRARRAAPHEH